MKEVLMKMRKIAYLFSAVALLFVFAACGGNDDAPAANGGNGGGSAAAQTDGGWVDGQLTGTLNLWTFTEQWQALAVEFVSHHPQLNLNVTFIDDNTGDYQAALLHALSTNTNVPDIVTLEAAFLRQFVETEWLADVSDLLPLTQELQTFPFTIEAGRHPDGTQRAFGNQATPGAMFFRRSLALEIFGTDDPAQLQNYFRDTQTTLQSAQRIHAATDGMVHLVSDAMAFFQVFAANRTDPWVVDGRLVIDPLLTEDFMDFAYAIRAGGFDFEINNWSEGWFAGMSDSFTDAAGNQRQFFAYMLPTWGLPYVLMPNAVTSANSTFGDWGIIPGPMPYQWGGTFFAVTANASNPDAARAFLQFAALDAEAMTNYALYGWSNEHLMNIYNTHPGTITPPVPAGLSIGTGDFMSSAYVVNNIAHMFDDSEAADFLGGQNAYAFFGDVAPYVSARLMQATDFTFNGAFEDATNLYITGQMTREQAIQNFMQSVTIEMPDLIID